MALDKSGRVALPIARSQSLKAHEHVPLPGDRVICHASFDQAERAPPQPRNPRPHARRALTVTVRADVAQVVDTRVTEASVTEVFVHYENCTCCGARRVGALPEAR